MLRAATGSVVKDVQLVQIVACSETPFRGGKIWQWSVQAGFEPMVANVGDILTQSAQGSKKAIAARVISYATLATTMLMSSGVISAGSKTVLSVLFSHQIADSYQQDLSNRAPRPNSVLADLLDPKREYPAGCSELVLVARFRKKAEYRASSWTVVQGLLVPVSITSPVR